MPHKSKKRNSKKKKSYNNVQDVLTVLAVLAVIMLAGASGVWLHRNPEFMYVITKSGSGSLNKDEAAASGKIIIIFITVISLIIIFLFIRSMIKRKRREALEARRALEKKMELEEARERVERARREAFINAGRAEIDSRKSAEYDIYGYNEPDEDYIDKYRIRRYSLSDEQDDYDNLTDRNISDGRKRNYYHRTSGLKRIWYRIKAFFKNLFS